MTAKTRSKIAIDISSDDLNADVELIRERFGVPMSKLVYPAVVEYIRDTAERLRTKKKPELKRA